MPNAVWKEPINMTKSTHVQGARTPSGDGTTGPWSLDGITAGIGASVGRLMHACRRPGHYAVCLHHLMVAWGLPEGGLRCESWELLHTVVLGEHTLMAVVWPGLLAKLQNQTIVVGMALKVPVWE